MNRPVVDEFIEAMEAGLEHGRKEGRTGWDSKWQDSTFLDVESGLLDKFDEEVKELVIAVELGSDDILREAADVANVAMMLADACGALEDGRAPD